MLSRGNAHSLLAIFLIMIGLAGCHARTSPVVEVVELPSIEGREMISLKSGYAELYGLAREWSGDACLTRYITFLTSPGSDPEEQYASMEFISETDENILTISLREHSDGVLDVVNQEEDLSGRYVWICIDPALVNLDTEDVLQASFEMAGREFLEESEADEWVVTITLFSVSPAGNTSNPCWMIRYRVVEPNQSIVIYIDAYTSELLEIISDEAPVVR